MAILSIIFASLTIMLIIFFIFVNFVFRHY